MIRSAQVRRMHKRPGYRVVPDAYELTNYISHSLESDLTPSPPRRGILSYLAGWRMGAVIAALVSIISLLINVVIAIQLSAQHKFEGGLATLYEGDCKQVQSYNLWFHLAINALSTVLLSGSNYCM